MDADVNLVFLDVPSNVTMVCLEESALISIRLLDHETVKCESVASVFVSQSTRLVGLFVEGFRQAPGLVP